MNSWQVGDVKISCIVEFKSAKPGTATLPNTRDNLAIKVLAESPRGIVYRATADPSFHEPARQQVLEAQLDLVVDHAVDPERPGVDRDVRDSQGGVDAVEGVVGREVRREPGHLEGRAGRQRRRRALRARDGDAGARCRRGRIAERPGGQSSRGRDRTDRERRSEEGPAVEGRRQVVAVDLARRPCPGLVEGPQQNHERGEAHADEGDDG